MHLKVSGLKGMKKNHKMLQLELSKLEFAIILKHKVEMENNMKDGNDHICESLLIFKAQRTYILLMNLAKITSCHSNSMWHNTGEKFRWYFYGKGSLVSLLIIFASKMTGKTSCRWWDLHWQVGFYCFSWFWYFLGFQEAFGNKAHVSSRNNAFQRDLTSPVQWGKHEFSGIK